MTTISSSSTSRDVNVTIEQSNRPTFRNRFSLRLPSVYNRKSSHATQSSATSSLGPSTPSLSSTTTLIPLSLQLSPFSSLSMDSTLPESSIAVPPTTNALDPQEKALLLKKTRKLSRVFGEEPSSIHQASHFHPHGGRQTSSSSSSSSSHRRSVSSATSHSSRRRQVVRRAPSQPDIRTSLLDEGSEPANAKASEDMDNSSLGLGTPEQLRRLRLAKHRRRLGDDRLPSELISRHSNNTDDLRFRKSLDAIPVARQSTRRSSDRPLRRTRSTLPELPMKVEPLVDDPVAFHRRYVQNFGCEGRVTQATRKQHQKLKLEQHPPEDVEPASVSGVVDVATESRLPQSASGLFSVAGAMKDGFASASNVSENEFDSTPPPFPQSNFRTDTAFQERRRRAAKLAQFFGVGYHDISSSLPLPDLVSHPSSYRPSPQTMPALQVDIAMKSRRFWGSGDDRWTYKDADMVDVIDKLRDLRA